MSFYKIYRLVFEKILFFIKYQVILVLSSVSRMPIEILIVFMLKASCSLVLLALKRKNSEKSTRLFYINIFNISETAFFKKKFICRQTFCRKSLFFSILFKSKMICLIHVVVKKLSKITEGFWWKMYLFKSFHEKKEILTKRHLGDSNPGPFDFKSCILLIGYEGRCRDVVVIMIWTKC